MTSLIYNDLRCTQIKMGGKCVLAALYQVPDCPFSLSQAGSTPTYRSLIGLNNLHPSSPFPSFRSCRRACQTAGPQRPAFRSQSQPLSVTMFRLLATSLPSPLPHRPAFRSQSQPLSITMSRLLATPLPSPRRCTDSCCFLQLYLADDSLPAQSATLVLLKPANYLADKSHKETK